MAIPKMSSQDFNDILSKAENKINDMNENISSIKNNIDKKLLIIKHETEYLAETLSKMSYQKPHEDGVYVMLNNNYKGLYESYSNVIHAYFKKDPINIFNLKSVNFDVPYFRDEVLVSINGVSTDYYKNILKADGHPSKEIFFEEYSNKSILDKDSEGVSYTKENNTIELSIEVDKQKVIGVSKFNMIEIDPYLYQSFDIEAIDIYGENYDKPLLTTNKISKVGKTRIILDKKYDFKKVVFIITPKYTAVNNGENIKPFGLKHIYFYEADFRNDSYIIVKYDSPEFIDHVKNDLEIVTPYGNFSSTLKEEGIKIYLENNNGILENEQEPSMGIKKPIARNLKTVYFKIPIGNDSVTKVVGMENQNYTNYRDSLIAIKFFIENR